MNVYQDNTWKVFLGGEMYPLINDYLPHPDCCDHKGCNLLYTNCLHDFYSAFCQPSYPFHWASLQLALTISLLGWCSISWDGKHRHKQCALKETKTFNINVTQILIPKMTVTIYPHFTCLWYKLRWHQK